MKWPEAVNVVQRLFLDSDGFCHPITNFLDDSGIECDAPEAVVAIAGTEGRWFAIRLEDFG